MKFCHQVLRLDYNAVADSIVRNGHRPAITEEQEKYCGITVSSGIWTRRNAAAGTRLWMYCNRPTGGKQQIWLLSGLKMGNETLPQKLNAMYTLLCSAHKESHIVCPRPNPEEVATAHKLVGYCMKDE